MTMAKGRETHKNTRRTNTHIHIYSIVCIYENKNLNGVSLRLQFLSSFLHVYASNILTDKTIEPIVYGLRTNKRSPLSSFEINDFSNRRYGMEDRKNTINTFLTLLFFSLIRHNATIARCARARQL